MKPKLLSVLVANLFVAAAPALAQDAPPPQQWSGSVSAGIRYVDNDAQDPSKFNEYRDLEDGTSGIFGFELRSRSQHNYFNAYGENLGQDDQYIDLRGGRYQTFKYRIYQDQLRHNFGSGPGALSPFSGIGTPVITAPFPLQPVDQWNTFNHSYKRRDTGGFVEWQKASPWYFRVDANEVRRDGINVYAGSNGTSPGNGFTDLPVPIDWTTRNYSGEVGYSTKRGHIAVNLSYSTFENENEVLRWSNRFFGNQLDTTVLPPDNDLVRIAVNGNLRQLPLNSTLAGRFTYSKLTNSVPIQQTMLSTPVPPGTFQPTNPSQPNFEGDVIKYTLGLAYNSHLSQALDTKVYYNWIKEENDSTRMNFVPGPGLTGGTCTTLECSNHLFEYEKHQIGVEAGYRLSRANKFSGGFEWTDIDRERADFDNNEEWRVFVEWKNSSFDWMTSRIKYQYLERSGDFNPDIATLTQNPMDLFVRRFDVANLEQNLIKLALDFNPAPLFDIGIEAIYKQNDYKDTILGRTEDERQELYASVGYGDPKRWRVFAFGDIEYVKFDSRHRVGTGNPDPGSGSTATTFNWNSKNEDDSWQVGIGADWAVAPRLMLKTSLIYAETDGYTDFRAEPGGPTAPFAPIQASDDTTRVSFNLKGVYSLDRHWELTAGYAYEKYRYSDIAYDNTRYVAGPAAAPLPPAALASTTSSIVTGQYSFQNYEAHIGYVTARYRF
jgi:MtrB/PioB family decaheme-associated outer membrane protein